MKLIIEIPEEVKEVFDKAKEDDLKGSYYDYNSIIGKAIQNSKPLSKGQWIPVLDNDNTQTMEETYGKVYKCSVCGFISYGDNFCPNCGANMATTVKYDSFRDFLETKYGIMIDDYAKLGNKMDCLYKLYLMKYIDKDIYGDHYGEQQKEML